ncbi:MAG: hypothetical protein AAFV93_10905, partial [Chloroflexota bacterium]
MMPDETPLNNEQAESSGEMPENETHDTLSDEQASEATDSSASRIDDTLILDDDTDYEEATSELNLSHEDATLGVDVISEDNLDNSPQVIELSIDDEDETTLSDELHIENEDATVPVSVLREEDLALLNEDPEEANDEEIVIKDFLNEDDGESLDNRDYLKPPEPEWKAVARQLREDREAQKRELIQKRREEDERVVQERKEYLKEREASREQQETEFRQAWEQRQAEKKEAVDDMMQRIREERERKAQERAETDEREFGRQFTYPKPAERAPYPKPSELNRM